MITKYLRIFVVLLFWTSAYAKTNGSFLFNEKIENIDGKLVTLTEFKGNVILIVNTASSCGYTPQYNDLEQIYQKYKKQGFTVLGFPSNDFGGQEPGSNQEIKKFCDLKQGKYKISFPLFGKSNMNSDPKSTIFKYLTEKANSELTGPVKWNFEKFIISKEGLLVKRFSSQVKPTSAEVVSAIEKELAR